MINFSLRNAYFITQTTRSFQIELDPLKKKPSSLFQFDRKRPHRKEIHASLTADRQKHIADWIKSSALRWIVFVRWFWMVSFLCSLFLSLSLSIRCFVSPRRRHANDSERYTVTTFPPHWQRRISNQHSDNMDFRRGIKENDCDAFLARLSEIETT